tara:strand:+ start:3130 stop:4482 length:1353 start_codon:yes stop_codon:yes gene_type:complete
MSYFSTKTLNKYFIINFLFSSLVISFILGNLLLNLNVVLLIVASLFFFKSKIFDLKLDIFDKILIFFFSYVLLSSFLNSIYFYTVGYNEDFKIFIKSITFLRFLILYFVIKFLIKEDIINFKIFFIISLISVTFVCADLIYQLIFGYDIFGYKAAERRLSGPFGDELIAGSFIQRFSLISLFAISFFLKFKKKNIKYLAILFFVFLFLFSLVISGNRIPLIFFILSLLSLIFFEKWFKKTFFILVPGFLLITFSIYNLNDNYRIHMLDFKKKAIQIFYPLSSKNIVTNEIEQTKGYNDFYTFTFQGKKYLLQNSHLKEFKSGLLVWSDKKIFGGGIKSFKISCQKNKLLNCGSHPHNYYIEILADLGLVGLVIIFFLFFLILLKIFFVKYFKKSPLNNFDLITPFIFLFLFEIFPIKSTGSFFTTGNATYIFLLLSIIISLNKIRLNRCS